MAARDLPGIRGPARGGIAGRATSPGARPVGGECRVFPRGGGKAASATIRALCEDPARRGRPPDRRCAADRSLGRGSAAPARSTTWRAAWPGREALLRDRDLARHCAAIHFGTTDEGGLYRRALADLGLAATRVAIVDDRGRYGIARGNRHGAATIWFRSGRLRDELPDAATGQPTYTITALAALLPVLGA